MDSAGNAIAFNALSPGAIWSNYIRYIGAGAVAAGGILSLVKSLPVMIKTFVKAMKGFGKNAESGSRTEVNISTKTVLIGVIVVAVVMWLLPEIPISLSGALIVVVFGFFFASVSSRMVGLVGSSNNPVSGMAIATLLIATLLLKSMGMTGIEGMTGAIAIGSVICVIAALAGDTSQDLKTGYLLGATPKKQQIGELIGILASSLAIGGVLYLLHKAWGYGTAEIPAPQATLMKMIVEGIMGGDLPWSLVFIGVFIAIGIEIVGVPVMPFAVGLYLPVQLNACIMIGGIINLLMNRRKNVDQKTKDAQLNDGTLYCAGMIAGEGLVGITLAILAVFTIDPSSILKGFSLGVIGSIVVLALIILTLLKSSLWGKNRVKK